MANKIVTVKKDGEVVLEFKVTNAMLAIAKKIGVSDKDYILALAEDKLEEKNNEHMRREVP